MSQETEATDAVKPSTTPLVLVFSAVFLGAHFASFALVNIGLVAAVLAALANPAARQAWRRPWPGWTRSALGVFTAWVVLSLAASPETWAPGAKLAVRGHFKPLLAVLVGYAAGCITPGAAHWMLPRLGWGAVAFLIPALPAMRHNRISLIHSVYGKEILGPNVLGGIFGSLFLLQVWRAWGRGEERTWGDYLLAAGLLLGTLVSGSRSAMILVIGGAFSAVVWQTSLKRMAQATGVTALALVVFLVANPRFIPGKFTAPTWELNVRMSIWKQAWRVIQERPVLGCGARRYFDKLEAIYPKYIGTNPDGSFYFTDSAEKLIIDEPKPDGVNPHPHDAHNDYITMAAFYGVPGLLGYLLFLGSVLMAMFRAGRVEASLDTGMARGLLALLVGVLGYTLFNACWFNKEWGPFTGWWIGAVLATARPKPEAELS